MKKLTALLLAPLLSACAADNSPDARRPSSDNEYITGSRIPGKGRGPVTTVGKEEVERLRTLEPQVLPDGMKPQ
jgi:hypothetical protein